MAITVGTDSYMTVAEADAYFNTTFRKAAWTALADNKEIALIEACRQMDVLIYAGHKLNSDQPLAFPRRYVSDSALKNWQYISGAAPDPTPQPIKYAQAELALWLFENQSNKALELQELGVKSISMANESYSFGDSGPIGPTPCKIANDFIAKWLAKSVNLC